MVPSLGLLSQYVDRGIVLSTCNRLEVYAFEDRVVVPQRVREFVAGYSGMSSTRLEPYFYEYWDADCVKHLFRVAAGLDSMVGGERQILGQVRTAYSAASELGCVRALCLGCSTNPYGRGVASIAIPTSGIILAQLAGLRSNWFVPLWATCTDGRP